jgi:hypothetical protein
VASESHPWGCVLLLLLLLQHHQGPHAHHWEQYSTSSSLEMMLGSTPPMNNFPCAHNRQHCCSSEGGVFWSNKKACAYSQNQLVSRPGAAPSRAESPQVNSRAAAAAAQTCLCELDWRCLALLPSPGLAALASLWIEAIHAIRRGIALLLRVHLPLHSRPHLLSIDKPGDQPIIEPMTIKPRSSLPEKEACRLLSGPDQAQ